MKRSRGQGIGGTGVMSIVLIVVVLSMSVMAMLTMLSARDDAKLSVRSAEVTETVYTLYDRSERSFARLDAIIASCKGEGDALLGEIENALPEEFEMSGDEIYWTESEGTHYMDCAVRVNTDGGARLEWLDDRITADMGDEMEW